VNLVTKGQQAQGHAHEIVNEAQKRRSRIAVPHLVAAVATISYVPIITLLLPQQIMPL
jgi:hypothetical protein